MKNLAQFISQDLLFSLPLRSWRRLEFVLQHRTFKSVVLCPQDEGKVLVYYQGRVLEAPRYCPHQKADLLTAKIKGGRLECQWHGCRIKMSSCR